MLSCNAVKQHVFEVAGLGKAPFRVVGVEERRGPIKTLLSNGVMAECGAPGQPMGVCDYCGTGIAECWQIKSADGQRFIVGCECVRKTGDAGLRRVINQHQTQKRHQREDERIAQVCERIGIDHHRVYHHDRGYPQIKAQLSVNPSPNEYRARNGDSALDWAIWMLRNAGRAGCMQVVRFIDKCEA